MDPEDRQAILEAIADGLDTALTGKEPNAFQAMYDDAGATFGSIAATEDKVRIIFRDSERLLLEVIIRIS